jgi:hypothetical protein
MKYIDETGNVYGKLTVLQPNREKKRLRWDCLCECGKTTTARGDDLRRGHTTSCGCQCGNAKHGGVKDAPVEFLAWNNLLKNHKELPKEWHDFVQFYCDVGERPSPNHKLGKKDVTKPHSQTNTIWRNYKDDREQRTGMSVSDFGRELALFLEAV